MIDENTPADSPSNDDDQAEDVTKLQDATGSNDEAGMGALSDIELLQEENAELNDKLLRTIAEMENLRRRTERERKDASRYAITNFAQDLLAIGDNLTRAMQSLEQAQENKADVIKTLVDGIEMTEREILNIFTRHGITRLEPQGEKFDPNQHQAMFEVDDPTVPSGMVMEVMQAGYTIGDRILRPAMVGVSKGGPKEVPVQNVTEPEEQAPQETTSSEAPVEQKPGAANEAAKGSKGPKDPANLGKRVDKSA